MTFEMEICGVRFKLDPAAISAIRYRAEYGDSIINHLAACATATEAEGRLLRMCHCMMTDRPELPELAKLARKDNGFFHKALGARNALLADDPLWHSEGGNSGEAFDEYRILALLSAARIDLSLVYELPILHLLGIAGRCIEAQDPDRTTYHEMDSGEMKLLYPRKEG